MSEPALRDDELRMLRGMIDDHRYSLERRKHWADNLSLTHKAVAGLVVVGALTLQVLTFVVSLRGH